MLLTLDTPVQSLAELYRDNYLASHKTPVVTMDFTSGNISAAKIYCAGWWSTLDWRYAVTAASVHWSITDQIANLITTYGTYLVGYTAEGTGRTTLVRPGDTTVATNGFQDGSATAQTVAEKLCEVGVTSGVRILAQVTPKRVVNLITEPSKTTASNIYLLSPNGELITPFGEYVRPELCRCGVWASIADFIPANVTISNLSDIPYFFIELSEYDAVTNTTKYVPRNTVNFWQITQAKNG
jgi:hypothetical protein